MTLTRLLQFALAQTWAMDEAFHRRMFQVLQRHGEGELSPIAAALQMGQPRAEDAAGDGRAAAMRVDRGVAVIPIHGVIAHRASAVDPLCSHVGTSVEHLRGDLQAALADDQVKAIVLDVDSPGGSVAGLDDLAAEIRAARARKPIVAHTDSMMASAAYWLASQANKVYATRDAAVGSIGVIASFLDNHRALADRGYDPVVIKSTPGKGHMQSNGTFGDANRADVQREVDQFHAMFVEAVAAGRGIGGDQASAMADGRVYIGAQAAERGYVDGVQPFAAAVRAARAMARSGAGNVAAIAEALLVDEDQPTDPKPTGNVAVGTPEKQENDPMTKTDDPSKNPAGAAAVVSPAPAAPAQAATNESAAAEAQKAERSRASTILAAAAGVQHALAQRLVAEGTPLADALLELNKDLQARLAASTALPAAATASLAAGNSASVAAQPNADARILAMPQGRDRWKAEFDADPKLAAEFGDFETYAGYQLHELNKAKVDRRSDD